MLGYVVVNAVPGNFHIEARGPEGRDINPQLANLSHVVHNFQVSQGEGVLLKITQFEFVCVLLRLNFTHIV